MKKVNIFKEIEGTEFPAGRKTRVIVGENGAMGGKYFCQGYVVIYPGGSVPAHDHTMVETYTILKGEGEMIIDGETKKVEEGDCIYVDSNQVHELNNVGKDELHMMFVYAPYTVADHWDEEIKGELK